MVHDTNMRKRKIATSDWLVKPFLPCDPPKQAVVLGGGGCGVNPANGSCLPCVCVASYQGKFQLRGPDVFIFHTSALPEAADLAQNHPLWRMMSTYGATQSETTTTTSEPIIKTLYKSPYLYLYLYMRHFFCKI